MDANPNVDIVSDNKGVGIAPAIAKESSVDFQKMDGKRIASGYINGINAPTDIAHNF